jgi:hypothetical protein
VGNCALTEATGSLAIEPYGTFKAELLSDLTLKLGTPIPIPLERRLWKIPESAGRLSIRISAIGTAIMT